MLCVDTVSRVGRTAAATLDAIDATCVDEPRQWRASAPMKPSTRREGKDAACYSLRELVRLAQRHENPEHKIPISHAINRWLSKITHPEVLAK